MTTIQPKTHRQMTERGFSLLELVIVLAISTIVTAIAVPQITASRRLQRMASLPRQITSQLRLARQLSMSQRRAITFQYDDQTKMMVLIGYTTAGPTVLSDSNYPNNTGSVQISALPLTATGINALEISYGIPSGLSTGALSDGVSLTALPTSKKINITFQPDGSVINAASQPTNFALYFYSPASPKETASAISVLGSSGRVKLWRYSRNASSYVE